MKQLYYCLLLLMGLPILSSSTLNAQTTVVLPASKDNTLYSEGTKSNGVGSYLFVGRTELTTNGVRRALVQFDVSSIPANATITGVQLKLTGSKQSANGIKVHRVTASWSEGTSNASGEEGGGATASINSSTWAFSNYNTVAWQNLGGDYTTTPSASANVSSGTVSTWSGASMLQDVQDWVSGKASNFGWLLIGDETTNGSAVRLNARENSSGKPSLEVTYSVGNSCRLSDSLELVKLYNATGGPNWLNKWNLGKPMSGWYGIGLNAQGCVGSLNLSQNSLSGSIPESFGNLQNLEILSLSNNDLSGSLPNSIGKLTKLEALFMESHPNFSGNIPSSIGQCKNLVMIYLRSMGLQGSVPPELGNLKKLKYLILDGNKLTGSIPQDIANLDSLILINIPNNQLSGAVPDFSRLNKLKHLGLNFNKLTTLSPKTIPLASLRINGYGCFNVNSVSGFSASICWIQGPFFYNNAFTFDDILPHYNDFFAAPYNYQYWPQDTIYKDTLIQKNTGQALSIDLGIDASITDNQYTWTKNGQFFKTITGNNKLEFTALQISDAGTYRVSVTNPRAPLLTLYSKAIRIGVTSSCRSLDSLVLVDLYKATNGANWKNKWDLSKPMSTWHGIVLDASGCVGAIGLADNGLSGNLPESLGNLSTLESLVLSVNDLSGSLPNGIGNLKKLETIIMDLHPRMSGGIPKSIGQCTNLGFIYLQSMNLEGAIPTELGNLKRLKYIFLGGNKLSSIPAQFANLDSLIFFNIANNQLKGAIPDLSRNKKLRHVGLNNNRLTSMSANIFPLDSLRKTGYGCFIHRTKSNYSFNWCWIQGPFLYDNAFTFEDILPHFNSLFASPYSFQYWPQDSIYKDTLIQKTSGQALSIDLGIDANITDNQYIWTKNGQPFKTITGNNKLEFPALQLSDAGTYRVVVTNPRAPALTLYGRNIKIEISGTGSSCRSSDSLELVKLYTATGGPNWKNKWDLGKPINTWYGIQMNSSGCVTCIDLDGAPDCQNQFYVESSGNNLVGSLPSLNLLNLTFLALAKNQLSGSIPNFNLPNLTLLDLQNNQLSGTIPSFNLPNLIELVLYHNRLGGSLPNFNLPKLEGIYLEYNQLNGTIPNFNLPKLRFLALSHNQLNGVIPNFNLPNLEALALAYNQLSGTIPNFNFSKLIFLGLSRNQLNGVIPNFNLPNLEALGLSYNQLSGTIPNFNLPNLMDLTLNNNQLTVLPQFTMMTNMGSATFIYDSLTLQKNQLSFDDILPNLSLIQKMGSRAFYSPQDSIYRDTLIQKNTGQALSIDLGIDASITDNQYTWTKNGQAFRTITGNNKLEFSTLQATDAGTYRVRVTNPRAPALTLYSKAIRVAVNNCVANAKLNSSATSDNICSGTSITLSASGGTTYRWSTGQSTSSINLSVSQNQTVTVSITDGVGCTQTLSRNLVALALPKAEISSSSTTICAGGKLSLSASPVSGAQYQWLRNNSSVLGPGSASTYEATQAGSYTVQVNVAGCTNTSAPLVLQQSSSNTAFKLNLSPTRDTICPGDSVQIIASGGLRYTWSTGSSSSAIVVKPVQSSTYAVTIADAGNCTSILRQTISLVAAPQARPRLSDLNCGFTLLAAGTGGRVPYRYRWSTGSTSSSVTVTKGGNYELLLVDARQCSAKASIVVDSFSFLTAAPLLQDPNCGAVDGSITLQLDPKREPYQIEWSPSEEGQGDNPRTQLDAGTYQALILDKQGCMDTIEVTLNKQEDCDKDFLIYRSFSPNRDGVNESFVIRAKRTGGCPSGDLNECYPNNELIIFNRWGEAVYRKKGYTADWDADGYPGGVYFFLFYPDRDKPKGVIRGALTVVK